MGIFDDISLDWGGRTYTIKSHRVMGAILRVEDVITLYELWRYTEREAVPQAKLAAAYGSVLRYAGAKVSDEEIYDGMFASASQQQILDSINLLLTMMLPPSAHKAAEEASREDTAGNPQRPRRRAAGSLSPKPSKPPSSSGA